MRTSRQVTRAIAIVGLQVVATGSHAATSADLQPNGSASTTTGTLVQLTPAAYYQAGSAHLRAAVPVSNGFRSRFEFRITPGTSCPFGADGLAFVIQNSGDGAFALGGTGGYLGYVGITPSLGVEFDTYNNGAVDAYDANHVGIDTNGSWASSPVIPLASPTFDDGNIHTAEVSYDGSQLSVVLDGSPVLVHHAVDLATLLGANRAYVGFSAGTGALCGQHDILSWDFAQVARIDIKPDGTPNSIDLSSRGVVPVAIFGSDSLDVRTLDPSRCRLAGASVKTSPSSHPLCAIGNVDADGYQDSICHFLTQQMTALSADSTEASLKCDLAGGTSVVGTDSVNIVH